MAESIKQKTRPNFTPFLLLAILILSGVLFFVFRVEYRTYGMTVNVDSSDVAGLVSVERSSESDALPTWIFWGYFFSAFVAFQFLIFHFTPPICALITFLVSRRKDYYNSWWFRQHEWEKKLCKKINLKKWKNRVSTYDRSLFSSEKFSKERLMLNITQSEIVHELIFVMSFLPLIMAKDFEHFPLLLILCIIFALTNVPFILIQRYNRPRVLNARSLR
ncbi:MAG: hypothetical protein IJ688_07025 [Treponema sp.]|nr:hypothetical protein [Treponema sp.]